MFVIIQPYYTKQCHNVKNKKSIHDDRVGVSDVNSFLSDHTNKTMVNQCLGGKEGGGVRRGENAYTSASVIGAKRWVGWKRGRNAPPYFLCHSEVHRLNYSYELICVNRRSYHKNPHKYFLRWRSVERPLRSHLLEYRRKSGAIFGAKLSSNDARAAVAEDLGIGSLSSGVQALCWRNTDARYCCGSHTKHIRWSLSKPFKNNHHCHQDGLVRISSIKSACKIVDHSREFGGRVVCHSEKCPGSLGICNRSV